jgi:hypothetical protein
VAGQICARIDKERSKGTQPGLGGAPNIFQKEFRLSEIRTGKAGRLNEGKGE